MTPMKGIKTFLIILFIIQCTGLAAQETPLAYSAVVENLSSSDWLVNLNKHPAQVYYTADKKGIMLYNGLVKRVFTLSPGLACTDFKNMSNGQQLIRALKPEAKITINGTEYNVGGLYGQKENAYFLNQWTDQLDAKADFTYQSFKIDSIKPFLNWKNTTWASNRQQGKGKMLTFNFESKQAALKGISISVHYELYDDIPLIIKWLSIENKREKAVKIDRVMNEILGVVEEESAVVGTEAQMKKQHGI